MLGRASSPHLGYMVSPRRGLKFPTTGDTRQGIEADGQHKTRNLKKDTSDDLGCPAFFVAKIPTIGKS